MSVHGFDPLTDRDFLLWARGVGERLWLGLGEAERPNDLLGFLWGIFVANGEVPPECLAPMVQERRIGMAKRYMRHFVGQARRDTGIAVEEVMSSSPPDDLEPTGSIRVGNNAIRGAGEPDIARETAEAVQDYVMSRHRTVWPVCPTHHLGYHPVLTGGTPEWECAAGRHRVAMLDGTCAERGRL
jgi:hypothetical protein